MEMSEIIVRCEQLVKEIYETMDASHDFQHIERVYQNAMTILKSEPSANKKIVSLAVLLHDVSDEKYAADKQQEQRILDELDLTEVEKSISVQSLRRFHLMGAMNGILQQWNQKLFGMQTGWMQLVQ